VTEARIVIGVDGSSGSARALRWALDEASLWDVPLTVVHSWYTPYPVEPRGVVVTPEDRELFIEDARAPSLCAPRELRGGGRPAFVAMTCFVLQRPQLDLRPCPYPAVGPMMAPEVSTGRPTMQNVSRHSGIEVIESDECRRLLAEDVIGRVAVVIGATPMILPVNYALDGDDIVMRTMPGSRLDVGQGHAAFEVDSFDRSKKSGWSVLVTGHLEEVSWYQTKDIERLQSLPVQPWAKGERNLWLRLRPGFITGRIVRGEQAAP
jgi:nitroimidazol reductase NimA-like FMN-containing flavoprotein (pyridoxamine 5'-phosphate oxidase superfamily)